MLHIPFQSVWHTLSPALGTAALPTPVKAPRLVRFNHALATRLGMDVDSVCDTQLADIFSGNRVPGNATPFASVYCGHQFGHLSPRLGDGRAMLLGEVVAPDGIRYDVQLKGAGRTPYSRSGDGRAPLGPALREYIVSEAMHALGIETTRALAVVASGEPVFRENPEPGAILTRVAASHIRIGTLEYFALQGDVNTLRVIADHVIARHYPDIDPRAEDRFLQLFAAICQRQATLIAKWLAVGFVHGVMNTDNMTLSGETIDYGPCAFLDHFDSGAVFSFIDRDGRYAYDRQPSIAQWNLARLAEAMLPLIDADMPRAVDKVMPILHAFPGWHREAWLRLMQAKFGGGAANDDDFIAAWLAMLSECRLDYTRSFRWLADIARGELDATGWYQASSTPLTPASAIPPSHLALVNRWADRCDVSAVSSMQRCNPWIIPRNHRIAEVIAAATHGDEAPFHRLVDLLANPWEMPSEAREFSRTPGGHERVTRTFCGT